MTKITELAGSTASTFKPSPVPIEAQPYMGVLVDTVRDRDKQNTKRCALAGFVVGTARFVKQHKEQGVPLSEATKDALLNNIVEAVEEYLS